MAYLQTKRRITVIGIKRLFHGIKILKTWPLVGTYEEALAWLDQPHLRRPLDPKGLVFHVMEHHNLIVKLDEEQGYPEGHYRGNQWVDI